MVIRAFHALIRALLVVGIAGVARFALAAGPATHSISIPVEDLGTALLTFAAATHEQIAFDYKRLEGYKSTALSGTYTAAEGLQVLIGTAPFRIQATPSGVLSVIAKPAMPHAADTNVAGAPSSASTQHLSAANRTSPEEVTVTARRAKLEPRVFRFVRQVATLEGDGLARWQRPLCPSVTGLSKDDGEFLLERISEIAHAAGVPLGAEHCRANLFVFVAADPKKLLEAMAKQDRTVTFGDAEPRVVDTFIATPQPARIWYDSIVETADNTRPIWGIPNGGVSRQQSGGGEFSTPFSAGRDTTDWERASHVARTLVAAFSYVYVVVDAKRLQGVTRGQLADYVSMVGLAEINPDAQLGDAPTILKLFDGAPQSAPPGLSAWDQAFLKSLYAIEQRVKVQQGEIALDMVRQIVH